MDIDLRQLRYLRVLAELGNFSRAAEALHITQSALSRSIQSLEDSVGAPLFVRQRGGIKPTELGQLVLRHALVLDISTRDLIRDIRLVRGLELGGLRIGVGPFGGSALIGPVIGRLNQMHPGLQVRLMVAPWQELPKRARTRDVDILVLEVSVVETLDDFETHALEQHPLGLVCRAGHPILQQAVVTVADFFRYPLAGPSLADKQRQHIESLRPVGVQDPSSPDNPLTIECDSSDLLKSILSESNALSLMPLFMIEKELASGLLKHLPGFDLGFGARFVAAWVQQRPLSAAGLKFIELLKMHDANLVRRTDT
jgi:DNA-binding transcriptional LysR family regulator